MFKLVWLRLKELFTYRVVIMLLVICPAIFGYISSYAMSGNRQDLSVALLDEDTSAESSVFIDMLEESPGLILKTVSDINEGNKLIDKRAAEGLLIIKSGFSKEILDKGRGMFEYIPAPGVSTAGVVNEAVSMAAVRMRAQNTLTDKLSELSQQAAEDGEKAFFGYVSSDTPVVSAVYHGEITVTEMFVSPRHGVAAVFMTLTFVIAVLTLPGRDKSRFMLYGAGARLKDYAACVIAVMLLFSISATVYFVSGIFIYGALPSAAEVYALIALCLFCIGFGGLFAAFLKDRRAGIFFYIPFLLLNMTAGGALWGRNFDMSVFIVLTPVALFIDAADGNTTSAAILTIACAAFLLISGRLASNSLISGAHL